MNEVNVSLLQVKGDLILLEFQHIKILLGFQDQLWTKKGYRCANPDNQRLYANSGLTNGDPISGISLCQTLHVPLKSTTPVCMDCVPVHDRPV